MARYVGQKEGKSLRDIYTKNIQEQESLSKYLRERQRVVQESHEPNVRQLGIWTDLEELMQAKLQAKRGDGPAEAEGHTPALEEEDRLVL